MEIFQPILDLHLITIRIATPFPPGLLPLNQNPPSMISFAKGGVGDSSGKSPGLSQILNDNHGNLIVADDLGCFCLDHIGIGGLDGDLLWLDFFDLGQV